MVYGHMATVSYIKGNDFFISLIKYWGIRCYVSAFGDMQSSLGLLVGGYHRSPLAICDTAVEDDGLRA